MSMRCLSIGIGFAISVTILVGCASTPERPLVQKGTIFMASAERTREAAADALVVLGFEVKKIESTYVEGFHPRKVGLTEGSSGGETVGVWLETVDASTTRVLVRTAKSLAGSVGQKNWDNEIIAEMHTALGN